MSVKPSILLLNRVYPSQRGATGRLLQDLARALEKSGWRVSVLAVADKASVLPSRNLNIRFIKGAKNPKTAFSCFLIYAACFGLACEHKNMMSCSA